MTSNKKGLGRGLSALIPDAEMDALSDVTREDGLLLVAGATLEKKAGGAAGKKRVAATDSLQKEKQTTSSPVAGRQELARSQGGAQRTAAEESAEEQPATKESNQQASLMIATDAIVPNPFQPRRTFDEAELQELAASIGLHGILQPVLVRPAPLGGNGEYQLVAGERRWRAAQQAGLNRIPVIVRPIADQQALELALIENVQRHDISAIDAAIAYQRLASEFTLSQEQIARRVGKSRSAVANTIRLLDLPEEARKAVESGAMSEGHGRAILLAGGEGTRRALLRRVLRDKLSVRDTENLARRFSLSEESGRRNAGADGKSPPPSGENEWAKAEQICTKRLGARVKVKATNRRSTILIECGSTAELQRVLALLQEKP